MEQGSRQKDETIGDIYTKLDLATNDAFKQSLDVSLLREEVQELRRQEATLNDALKQSKDQQRELANEVNAMTELLNDLEGMAATSHSTENCATKIATNDEKAQPSIILVNSTDSQENLTSVVPANTESLLLESQEECPVIEDPDFSIVPATQDQLLAEESLRVAREAMQAGLSMQNAMAELIPATPERDTVIVNANSLKRKRAVEKKVRFASQQTSSRKGPWEFPEGSSPQALLQYNAAKHRQKPDTEPESTNQSEKKQQLITDWNQPHEQDLAPKDQKSKKDKPEEGNRSKRKTGPAAASAGSQSTRKPKKYKK
ncbi:hypothetical protein TWF696_004131 [Orbilia brochopaga]|uniref:Uncharacterized protein n=1 Tax=Orbilia brochopaga TaxID=3140254 RepID=A0AAV9V5X8_9PEZI